MREAVMGSVREMVMESVREMEGELLGKQLSRQDQQKSCDEHSGGRRYRQSCSS